MLRIFLALLFLAACGPTGNKDIVAQYQNTARTVGITPVYPPEEWLQVGDVFVQSIPKSDGGLSLRKNPNDKVQLFFGASDTFLKATEKFMGTRIAFLRTSVKPAANGTVATQSDFFGGRFRTRAELDVETLPIVAFPEVTADAGTNLGFSIVRLFHAIGIGAGQRTQVILNFNDVRKYGIPKLTGYTAANAGALEIYTAAATDTLGGAIDLNSAVTNLHVAVNESLRQELLNEAQRLKLVGAGGSNSLTPIPDRCKRFLVLTEVYVTRTITYTFRNAQILALAAQSLSKEDKDETAVGSDGPDAIQTNIVLNGTFPNAADGTSNSPVTIVNPEALQTAVTSSLAQAKAGEGLVFNRFTARGAEFRQTFERPVAIGFEAIGVGFPTQDLLLNSQSKEKFEDCLM
ncbi:hypothetical protein [uncultured Sulfitobacter sp.]|uniref:hypothetical protein n=1 Tax=uncultured Sulfitobacter sp. TaxID=191468 RepID=UPI00261679CA|nr:hypothetical protein [uncultured Sulfitobacter sp.]